MSAADAMTTARGYCDVIFAESPADSPEPASSRRPRRAKASPAPSKSSVPGSGTGDGAAASAKMRTPRSMSGSGVQGQHDRCRKSQPESSCANAWCANGATVLPDIPAVVPENAGPEGVCARASNEIQKLPGGIVQFNPDWPYHPAGPTPGIVVTVLNNGIAGTSPPSLSRVIRSGPPDRSIPGGTIHPATLVIRQALAVENSAASHWVFQSTARVAAGPDGPVLTMAIGSAAAGVGKATQPSIPMSLTVAAEERLIRV